MPIRHRVSVVGLCFFALLIATPTQLLAVDPLNPDALADTLDKILDNHSAAKRTTLTLKVVDLETGEVLYDRDGDKLLTPASNLKIYTAAAALDLLGPDYKWETEVYATSNLKRGTISGDLLIHGTGDPMLDTKQLRQLADQLINENKLERVKGSVRVMTHPSWGNVPIKGPGWMWDDEPDYYNMSIRSTMLNFNVLKVKVQYGDPKLIVTLDPAADWPPVEMVLALDNRARGEVRVTRLPFTEPILISGNPLPESEPVSEEITMHDPARWTASVFEQMLIARGVKIEGSFDDRAAEYNGIYPGKPLASATGKSLSEAIQHFLKVSENAVGEMVLLKLAETQENAFPVVTWSSGAYVISDWLISAAGLEEGSFRLVDGSGLSRYNLISADSSVKLLAFMKNHEHFEPFFDGLPVYKVELPKDGKWGEVPFAEFDPERVFAKPGGMSGVSTISGYIKTLDGRWLAFSLLGNGYIGSSKPVRDLRNEVWAELIRYRSTNVKQN